MLYCAFSAIKTAVETGIMGSRNSKISYEFALLSVIHRCKNQGLFIGDDGNTPLHIACSIPVSSVPVGSRLLYPLTAKCVVRDRCVVDFLVRACPEAAHERNMVGKLPLHNMVEAEGSSWEYGIWAVLGANPSALAELDLAPTPVFSMLREQPDLLAAGGDGNVLAQESKKSSSSLSKLRMRRIKQRRHRPYSYR